MTSTGSSGVNGRPSRATQGHPLRASAIRWPGSSVLVRGSPPSSVGGPAPPGRGLLLRVLGAEAGARDLDEVGAVGQAIEGGRGEQGLAEGGLPPAAPRPRRPPRQARTAADREEVLALLHEERFVDLPPAQVWAQVLDAGHVPP